MGYRDIIVGKEQQAMKQQQAKIALMLNIMDLEYNQVEGRSMPL